ncbi:MAG: 4-hydroxy-tetrahydrodipicolinate reductase (EC [uncultured Campylobacterales bacterium]|uniref:4-hydroxy-tetrahydrodipicolinate reductase n=1 Tax=uncultured Campylobacterales bacterium TaxID=352960 RepID=A0A6S6S1T7_9BACT|nr:MAG: 4-hydroxy-tetrahydrodipicolinate reductase (EC [uncultured Campylobacterales bacterium]
MKKVGVYGASGKMGKLIVENLLSSMDLKISVLFSNSKLDLNLDGVIETSDINTLIENSDIIIDFTIASACEVLLDNLISNPKALVCGTTGLNQHQTNLINELSQKAPVLYATNTSLGVAVLNKLVSLASQKLKEFDCEIVEQHHRYKKDAPSGTAMTLAHTAADARDLNLDKVRISGRDGEIGARSKDEIAVMSLRGGDIVGRHTVGFYNDGEFIELNHTATSRQTFAKGAVKSAEWLIRQKENKLYSINDMLGI